MNTPQSSRFRCPGVGRDAQAGRQGAADPTAPCPVCAHRARVRMDGTVGVHTLGESAYRRVSGAVAGGRVVGYHENAEGIMPVTQAMVDAGQFTQVEGRWIEVAP